MVLPPATKTTGFCASASERRCRRARASFASSPPTSMPSIVTPEASLVGDPANAKPSTTSVATTASRSRRTRRRTPTSLAGSEHEQLDSSRDVEVDSRDVRGQLGAEERDRVRDLLGVARPAERRPPDDPLVHLGVPHLVGLRADDAR